MKTLITRCTYMMIMLVLITATFVSASSSSYYEYTGAIGTNIGASTPDYTLGNPVGISKDSFGNYFIADMANGRILKLNENFEQIAVLNGIDMPLYVYVDNNDDVLVLELGTNSVQKYDNSFNFILEWGEYGDEDGQFNIPRSIVQDSLGNYYVSDELNHRIQKFTEVGVFIAAYGQYGSGEGEFSVQQGLSIDAMDRIYVADTYNNRIQVFQTDQGWEYLTSFGTYGVYNAFDYTSYQSDIFNHPRGVYVDPSTGQVVVTDSSNNRVMVYSSYENGFQFEQSQNGYLGMTLPTHAILSDGKLLVLDSHSRIIEYLSSINNTNLFIEYGSYRNGSDLLSNPQNVTVNQNTGDVYVTDSFNHRIMRYDEDGVLKATYGGSGGPYGYGTALGYFLYPKQVAVDEYGGLYIADYGNSRIVYRNPYTGFYMQIASVYSPWGVAYDGSGKIYVSSWYDDTIKVYQNGFLINTFGGSGSGNGELSLPADLAIGVYQGQEALFVADCGNNRIQIFSMQGAYLGALGESSYDPLGEYAYNKSDGGMLLPYGVAIDADDNIVVSDTSHKCIRIYNSNGVLIETWGDMSSSEGNFFSPMGLDINLDTGRLYIADGVLERVQYYDLMP